ncbi:hypothetical protein Ddc_22555 [Ditylenchus destructor]|nr:hypothetical protein Ddc_22555 [Ditylenchus destructor]
MCCFRKNDKATAATSASPKPASTVQQGDIGATLSPIVVTSASKMTVRTRTITQQNQTDVTQNTVDDLPDSFAAIQPSVKSAKRAKEIQRQGSIKGKRKKQYKTFNVEDMSDFNKTMELAEEDPEFTCTSGHEKKAPKK